MTQKKGWAPSILLEQMGVLLDEMKVLGANPNIRFEVYLGCNAFDFIFLSPPLASTTLAHTHTHPARQTKGTIRKNNFG